MNKNQVIYYLESLFLIFDENMSQILNSGKIEQIFDCHGVDIIYQLELSILKKKISNFSLISGGSKKYSS